MDHKVKSYKRRTKSGKIITVRAHSRKGKDYTSKSLKKGGYSGEEFKKRKSSENDPFWLPPTGPDERLNKLREKAKSYEKLPPSIRDKKMKRLERLKERYVNFNAPAHHRKSREDMKL